jgi:hypothetical protein
MASLHRTRADIHRDESYPNIYWIEPNSYPVLIQVDRDRYEVRQGRCILGMVVFHDGAHEWGWRYYPRQVGRRPSRVLHLNPEAALRGRVAIGDVITKPVMCGRGKM